MFHKIYCYINLCWILFLRDVLLLWECDIDEDCNENSFCTTMKRCLDVTTYNFKDSYCKDQDCNLHIFTCKKITIPAVHIFHPFLFRMLCFQEFTQTALETQRISIIFFCRPQTNLLKKLKMKKKNLISAEDPLICWKIFRKNPGSSWRTETMWVRFIVICFHFRPFLSFNAYESMSYLFFVFFIWGGEGDGDCDFDLDCKGTGQENSLPLICGSANAATFHPKIADQASRKDFCQETSKLLCIISVYQMVWGFSIKTFFFTILFYFIFLQFLSGCKYIPLAVSKNSSIVLCPGLVSGLNRMIGI